MQNHWQRMHDQTCMMAPGTCPRMGTPAPPPSPAPKWGAAP